MVAPPKLYHQDLEQCLQQETHSVSSRLGSWREGRPGTQTANVCGALMPLSVGPQASGFGNKGPYEQCSTPGPRPAKSQPQTPWAGPGDPHFNDSERLLVAPEAWELCSASRAGQMSELAPNARLHAGEVWGELLASDMQV